jgi:hypothetical protein
MDTVSPKRRRAWGYAPALALLMSLAGVGTAATEPLLVSAVTPVARAAQLNKTVTAFATIINAGNQTATGCTIAKPAGSTPVDFTFRTIASDGTLGLPGTPVDIPGANGKQNFLLTFTPTRTTAPNLALVFDCTNSAPAASIPGLNTFLINGTTFAPPDVIATAVTASLDGILTVPFNGAGAAALAAINIGTSGNLTARVSAFAVGAPAATLPGTLTLCQTNLTTGLCLAPPTSDFVNFTSNANTLATFTAFYSPGGATVAFDPANKRIFVNFILGTTPVGSASVAVRTQ